MSCTQIHINLTILIINKKKNYFFYLKQVLTKVWEKKIANN